MGISRVLVGVHYPHDDVLGAMVRLRPRPPRWSRPGRGGPSPVGRPASVAGRMTDIRHRWSAVEKAALLIAAAWAAFTALAAVLAGRSWIPCGFERAAVDWSADHRLPLARAVAIAVTSFGTGQFLRQGLMHAFGRPALRPPAGPQRRPASPFLPDTPSPRPSAPALWSSPSRAPDRQRLRPRPPPCSPPSSGSANLPWCALAAGPRRWLAPRCRVAGRGRHIAGRPRTGPE